MRHFVERLSAYGHSRCRPKAVMVSRHSKEHVVRVVDKRSPGRHGMALDAELPAADTERVRFHV